MLGLDRMSTTHYSNSILQTLPGGFPWQHFATLPILQTSRKSSSEFYHRFLGTEELGRSTEGDITITDGFYNLTFFKKRPSLGEMHMELGLHHIGLQVDDLEEVKGRFIEIESARHDHSGSRMISSTARSASTTRNAARSLFRRAASACRRAKKNASRACAISPTTPSIRRSMLQFYTQVFRPARSSVELPAPPAGPRQSFLRRRQDQSGDPSVLQSNRRPRSQIRHQSHRLSDQRDAGDDGGTEQRLENRAAPVDAPLRGISLPRS